MAGARRPRSDRAAPRRGRRRWRRRLARPVCRRASPSPTPPATFPWATFAVNVSGAFAMGLLVAFLVDRPGAHRLARPFVGVGVLGGWTTFSALAVDVVQLGAADEVQLALAYVAATFLVGTLAVGAGHGCRATGLAGPVTRARRRCSSPWAPPSARRCATSPTTGVRERARRHPGRGHAGRQRRRAPRARPARGRRRHRGAPGARRHRASAAPSRRSRPSPWSSGTPWRTTARSHAVANVALSRSCLGRRRRLARAGPSPEGRP